MMVAFQRRALAWMLALVLVSVSVVGSVASAQDTTPVAEPQTTQPVENDDDGFPWGLLGLLGLGGLAGLRRQEQPARRVETVDASRRS